MNGIGEFPWSNSKPQITNTKQITMTQIQNPKSISDLEKNCFLPMCLDKN
jgi:hypothetical protein